MKSYLKNKIYIENLKKCKIHKHIFQKVYGRNYFATYMFRLSTNNCDVSCMIEKIRELSNLKLPSQLGL